MLWRWLEEKNVLSVAVRGTQKALGNLEAKFMVLKKKQKTKKTVTFFNKYCRGLKLISVLRQTLSCLVVAQEHRRES